MTNSKSEPMVTNQVHTTKDYFLFKSIDGNRNKNLLHINRLKKSMQECYLFTVIIVNEKYEIIDGQHRFDVIEELKLPLNYIICKGYGLNEVHRLNTNSKTWNADDYLEGYCRLGYIDYIKYKQFKDKYDFGHNECIRLLGGSTNGNTTKYFYAGKFTIKNYNEADRIANLLNLFQTYYKGYKRRSFVNAIITLLNNPNFEFTELMIKLKSQPTALQDCNDVSSYIALIEEIYNYRRREKVNLRY
jgi:hypothetical protein